MAEGESPTEPRSSEPSGVRRGASRAASLVSMLAIAALGVWSFTDLSVRTDITEFVPEGDDAELAAVAREVTDSELARTSLVTVGPLSDAHAAARAAALMGAELRSCEEIAWVRTGPPEDAQTAFYELYFPRRLAFSAASVDEARRVAADPSLGARARAMRSELTGPTAMLVRRIAPEDPLLTFPALLRAFQGGELSRDGGAASALDVVDGTFVVRETGPGGSTHWGVVMLASRGTTFRAEAQEPVLAAIDTAFEVARVGLGDEGTGLRLEQAGVARFAVRTERALRNDTTRISTVSTIAIVVLFLILFRGPRYLLLGGIPLGVGTVASVLACRLVFGGVHAITLAFGSSLLGVGIDFISHYVNQHVLEPKASPEATMAHIRPGLVLGASTTIAGLAGLGFASFPGMRELALFAAAGVSASLAATLWLVPPWMPSVTRVTAIHQALARSQAWLFERMRTRLGRASLLPGVAIAISLVGLPQLSFVDDLRRMNEIDSALASEDRTVRSRVAQGEAGRFVMAVGDDDETALQASDRAEAALLAGQEAHELTRYRSVFPFLRSARTQREVDAVFREDGSLAPRLDEILEREDFVPEMFAPFAASLAAPASPPLTFEMLASSSLGPLVAPFRVEVRDREGRHRIAYLTFVEGVTDGDALARRLEPIEGVRYFDQARYLEGAYRAFRERSFLLVLGGLAVVFVMCLARYRSFVLGIAAVAPALLASTTSLAILALFGVEANLMHLVACLLVLSMGEDYAVFLLEERDAPKGPATTMVGILLACVTTVLSFGLLAASAHPALRALGFVTSLGVGLAFVLSPLAVVIARAARPAS